MRENKDVFFIEGYDACEQGADRSDCPYPQGTDAENGWLMGWYQRYKSEHEG